MLFFVYPYGRLNTGNIYAHAIRSADEAAAEVLEDIFKMK